MATEFRTMFRTDESKNTKYNRLAKVVEETADPVLAEELGELFKELRFINRRWDALVLGQVKPGEDGF
ncbi:MAG: hypothetical protein DMG58_23570 [Acidobacteria bacterium]|nr:MAG: hypothetical protein DMG58_23570 [Acidobacteriota bacterium]